ncbi:MAG: hypothetical protein M0Z54_02940 [Thermaerobacter sp.]|nr:hypothetical protein [Thermaerobacter sp.]
MTLLLGRIEALQDGVDALVQPLARIHQVVLTCRTPATRVPIRGDGGRLRQALANLAANAPRVTPAGGHVDVTAAVESDGTLWMTSGCAGLRRTWLMWLSTVRSYSSK